MTLKKIISDKKNFAYIILFLAIVISCLWAFISAGVITKSFKNKIIDQTYQNKEANIESLLVTETKDGTKLWELFSDKGMYTDSDNVVLLEGIIGNFYDNKVVKASFKADKGTYNATKKVYAGKDKDIVAEGNIRLEKPNEAIIYGRKAILEGDFSDFHIEGRTKTQFYM